MSEENHPNFNAARFAANIMVSYYESIRGPLDIVDALKPPDIREKVLNFVTEVEEYVDRYVDENTKAEE